ncbi:MAG: hypothetical protein K0S38_167 [Candidatus Paceibacter sp.]|jgi:hypothetical protein|nr:hypothetical protein [Candidatus Paceibacter sp.]
MQEQLPNNNEDAEKGSYDFSNLSSEARQAVFDRIVSEHDEKSASEALQINQPFSVEELEQLVSLISDPQLALEALTIDDSAGKKLTDEQKESLWEKIAVDDSALLFFYMQLIESGVAESPTEAEQEWLGKLEIILSKTEEHETATYILEHMASLSDEDRARLEALIEEN